MKRVTMILVLALGALVSACSSAPPTDESSITPDIEVQSVQKEKIEDPKAGVVYSFTVDLVLTRRGTNGLIEKGSKGTLKLYSNQSKPLHANSKDDTLTLDVACRDADCSQFSLLVTATPLNQPAQASPGTQELKLLRSQLAVLLVDTGDGNLHETDRRTGAGELASAASLL